MTSPIPYLTNNYTKKEPTKPPNSLNHRTTRMKHVRVTIPQRTYTLRIRRANCVRGFSTAGKRKRGYKKPAGI